MEKVIIGVIASDSYEYNLMKKIWENNVDNCQKNIEVYFLYGNEDLVEPYNIEINTQKSYNFYIKCEEIFDNLLYKTMCFFCFILCF